MTGPFTVRALSPETWEPYAALLARHGGAGMGGCWCMWLHNPTMAARKAEADAAGGGLAAKRARVESGRAHAAVVFDRDLAVGWCQYGPPAELTGLAHRREIEGSGLPPADYRLGCFFVDRSYRRSGVASAALAGALDLVGRSGGGVVEA